ncbi:MAG: methyltransferase domain-containing protein [Candidatus Neomarinimicrobiota bacterium]
MICGQASQPSAIDLPRLPMTEIYVAEKVNEPVGRADQGLDFCPACGHAQLRNVIDVGLQYGETFSYFFRTSESATGRSSAQFFRDFMKRTSGDRHFRHILEVGCNDLYLLKELQGHADHLTGIDPILKDFDDDLAGTNLTVIGDFFENVELERNFDLLICKDTLEHVADPKNFTRRLVDRAADDTLFYFQFPCLESTLKDLRFDQIFHQHLNYFTLQSVIHLLNELGCELIDYTFNFEHWGALLVAFRKGRYRGRFDNDIWQITPAEIARRYQVFKQGMAAVNARLKYFADEKIYGYGAALMLPVLSYYLENDLSGLECIVDDDPRKDGLYYLNLPVPIRGRAAIANEREAVFLLTAVASLNNVRAMLPNLFKLRPKHVIVPLNTI